MILTLCGSLRYEPYWHEANKLLGLAGHICFSVMTFPSIEGSKSWHTDEQKTTLDLAHFAKIEASDGVVMLNIDRYLGESSLRELSYARIRSKKVFWAFDDDRVRFESYAINLIYPLSTKQDWTDLSEAVKAKESTL